MQSTVTTNLNIAVDVMSGDAGYKPALAACVKALEDCSDLNLMVVGDRDLLEAFLRPKFNSFLNNGRIKIKHAATVVNMEEHVVSAMRKKDSSMRSALLMLKDEIVTACVSAGNTGALVALSTSILKTHPDVTRPAIMQALPTEKHGVSVRILDLGATLTADAAQLCELVYMGAKEARINGIKKPKIALLNIGKEDIKGLDSIKEANKILRDLANKEEFEYYGYIEANEIISGIVDVVVCDGFVGNIALKTIEGTAMLLVHKIKSVFNAGFYEKFLGFLIKPLFKRLFKIFDPASYNGAVLLGLNGIVIKSHGNALENAFYNAILMAANEARMSKMYLNASKR